MGINHNLTICRATSLLTGAHRSSDLGVQH